MSTYVHSLLQSTLDELTGGTSIIRGLRSMVAIARSLDDEDLLEWAERELSGYPKPTRFPNPKGHLAHQYRLAPLTVTATFHVKVGIKTTARNVTINMFEVEVANDLSAGVLSKYFISNPIEVLERHGNGGNCRFDSAGLKDLVAAFFAEHNPGSTCKQFHALFPASSMGSAAKGARIEAIKRLMGTGLGREPLVAPLFNVHMDNSVKDQRTKVNAAGGQVGNIIAHSTLTDNHLPVTGQRLNAAPRNSPFEEDESRQFREDVKSILHLLVDRYEDLDESVANSLQNTLKLLRAVEIQGKTVAELDDVVGDIWAKNEVASMQVPQFVAEAITQTKVLGGLVTKLFAG